MAVTAVCLGPMIACAEGEESSLAVARQPAEFEPQSAVWLIWPQADHLAGHSNEEVTLAIIAAVAPHTPVKLVVTSESLAARAHQRVPSDLTAAGRVEIIALPAVQFWIRDMGPNFVTLVDGRQAVVDFAFDSWGYATRDDPDARIEDRFDALVADRLQLPTLVSSLVSEGGDREVNGRGTLMAVEAVEMGRNPGWTKAQIEAEFRRTLGVTNVIWLKQGLREDDHTFRGPLIDDQGQLVYTVVTTNGHVDEFARFVDPSTVLLAEVPPEDRDDPIGRENHARLEENYEILQRATDQDGRPLNIVRMPLPRPVYATMRPGDEVYDYIATLDYQDGSTFPAGEPVRVIAAASYLNFLITDEVVVGQKYWRPGRDLAVRQRDEAARRILAEAFPQRDVVMIDAVAVNLGGGGIHCITMPQPRVDQGANAR